MLRLLGLFILLVAATQASSASSQPVLIANSGRVDTALMQVAAEGDIVATSTQLGSVDLWSLQSGRRVRSLEIHNPVGAIALSPDGAKLAVLSYSTLLVFDVRSGAKIRQFSDRPVETIEYLAFGGQSLLTTWNGSLVRLDLVTGAREVIAPVTDRSSLAAGDGGAGQIVDLVQNSIVLRGAINSTLRIADAQWAVAAPVTGRLIVGGRMKATLWAINGTRLLGSYPWNSDPRSNAPAMFSPDGKTLLLPSANGLQVIDATSGQVRSRLPVSAVSYVPTNAGGPVLAAELGIAPKVWNPDTTRVILDIGVTLPTRPRARSLPSGNAVFISDETGGASLWNFATGQFQSIGNIDGVLYPAAAQSRDRLAWLNKKGEVFWWDSGDDAPHVIGKIAADQGLASSQECRLTISPDGTAVFVSEIAENTWSLMRFDIPTGAAKKIATSTNRFSRCILAVNDDKVVVAISGHPIILMDGRTGRELPSLGLENAGNGGWGISDLDANADNLLFVDHNANATVERLRDRRIVNLMPRAAQRGALLTSATAAISDFDGNIEIWDLAVGRRTLRWPAHNGWISSLASLGRGRLLISTGEDGQAKVWNVVNGQLQATLFPLKGGGWVAATPDGRFDSSDIETANAVAWSMPDDPLRPLPAEIFLRDFYQPRLIPSLMSCLEARTAAASCSAQSVDAVPLSALNRIRPDVRIIDVKPGSEPQTIIVSVKTSSISDATQPNQKTRTDAYDLRLFRDGQLVGQWPAQTISSDDLLLWRQQTLISTAVGPTIHQFQVSLPTASAGRSVSFTAYAFNEDRVKSATAQLSFALPVGMLPRPRRAYVITIGADAYEAPDRALHFAVRDAEAMAGALAHLEDYKSVPVSLTSAGSGRWSWKATKANIRAVLARLAGTTSGALAGVKGAEQLARATPDDVVIVTFSGHGYTTPQGRFYLLPSDSGSEMTISSAALARFISSDEISEWLRPIDAGQMALVIDACHSAASIDQPGFKPGPMGDPGLGQLAYDKAMRILAASQADAVALESARLKQGLPTYALVHDGLARGTDGKRAADADHDGRLTLAEWLRWGEQRTPAIYADIQAGRRDAVYADRDGIIDPRLKTRTITRAQTPALFDFAKPSQASVYLP